MTNQGTIGLVEGPNLTLLLIQPEDAGFVYGLRNDPFYNQHLSEVNGSLEGQRSLLEHCKV